MDFEKEPPAFALMNQNNIINISWEELKKAEIGHKWENKESATVIYKDDEGALIRFKDEYGDIYLNYFHFL